MQDPSPPGLKSSWLVPPSGEEGLKRLCAFAHRFLPLGSSPGGTPAERQESRLAHGSIQAEEESGGGLPQDGPPVPTQPPAQLSCV